MKLIYRTDRPNPTYATAYAVGLDLPVLQTTILAPGITVVDTELYISGPKGYGHYIRIAPKSGLALKGIDVLAGVVDVDYKDSIKVVIINHSNEPIILGQGKSVAQAIVERAELFQNETIYAIREGGFGSTGR